ncbi:hypothetical protein GC177_07695 [bacterium]|nr:hypothetical protein [bacterium]
MQKHRYTYSDGPITQLCVDDQYLHFRVADADVAVGILRSMVPYFDGEYMAVELDEKMSPQSRDDALVARLLNQEWAPGRDYTGVWQLKSMHARQDLPSCDPQLLMEWVHRGGEEPYNQLVIPACFSDYIIGVLADVAQDVAQDIPKRFDMGGM